MRLPSGDHAGWRASWNRSVIRLAFPPSRARVQRDPCRSMTSRDPSGDAATAIDVPWVTVTVRWPGAVCGEGAAPARRLDTATRRTRVLAHAGGGGGPVAAAHAVASTVARQQARNAMEAS